MIFTPEQIAMMEKALVAEVLKELMSFFKDVSRETRKQIFDDIAKAYCICCGAEETAKNVSRSCACLCPK